MNDINKNGVLNIDPQGEPFNTGERTSLSTRTKNNVVRLPGPLSNVIREAFEVDKPNPFHREFDIQDGNKSKLLQKGDYGIGDIRNYATLTYNNIQKFVKKEDPYTEINDFRRSVDNSIAKTFSGNPDKSDYTNKNLEKNGWGTQGAVGANRSDYTKASARGDKVNKLDFLPNQDLDDLIAKGNYTGLDTNSPGDIKDFIAFYFAGPKHHEDTSDDVMIFRANIQGFADSFSPEWNPISIMGRADKAYIYTGFERSVSFTFTAAATSREEMKPMWRKLNYLATYTMPDYNTSGRLLGPFMRMTIGNLFQNTPGFLESFSISIPDEATWELGNDNDMLQLPMMAEVSITFKVLSDYRPQKLGRAYSLSKFGKHGNDNNWLSTDSSLPTTIDSDKTQTGDKKLATDKTPADSRQDNTTESANASP